MIYLSVHHVHRIFCRKGVGRDMGDTIMSVSKMNRNAILLGYITIVMKFICKNLLKAYSFCFQYTSIKTEIKKKLQEIRSTSVSKTGYVKRTNTTNC